MSLYEISPDTSINVVASGKKVSTRPTLIFLHFWGGSSRTFTNTITYLSPHFHCIAVDFPGWGSSIGPQKSEAYSIAQLAIDIETLIPKLDVEDFVLVGHSMGGKVSQHIAGRNQLSGLKAVVLLGPAPPTPFSLPPDMKQQQISAYSSHESAEFVVRNVLSSAQISDEMVSALVEDMLKGTELATKAWPAYAMAEDIATVARKITVPVLVIGGELDKVEPIQRLEEKVLANINGAEMVLIKGSGHLLPVEAPEQVASHIEAFVQKVTG
ncbi:alpha/beta-hydrolase [Mollisia scopiformis]|uniref:Alpha/beta-hydrolase n=1 Tax=Mollisia scopiformis TaxID=149040 RepID=A0A194WUX9_MOLSC|nr:alpha/beta-hydrolase [Mollisia scopiformis]KUJ11760.1 alpha/beta-hydrolase [Mollisia scopiformis]